MQIMWVKFIIIFSSSDLGLKIIICDLVLQEEELISA